MPFDFLVDLIVFQGQPKSISQIIITRLFFIKRVLHHHALNYTLLEDKDNVILSLNINQIVSTISVTC